MNKPNILNNERKLIIRRILNKAIESLVIPESSLDPKPTDKEIVAELLTILTNIISTGDLWGLNESNISESILEDRDFDDLNVEYSNTYNLSSDYKSISQQFMETEIGKKVDRLGEKAVSFRNLKKIKKSYLEYKKHLELIPESLEKLKELGGSEKEYGFQLWMIDIFIDWCIVLKDKEGIELAFQIISLCRSRMNYTYKTVSDEIISEIKQDNINNIKLVEKMFEVLQTNTRVNQTELYSILNVKGTGFRKFINISELFGLLSRRKEGYKTFVFIENKI